MSNLEQLIRILLFVGAGAYGGDSFANSDMVQSAISAVVVLMSFGWWFYENNIKSKS